MNKCQIFLVCSFSYFLDELLRYKYYQDSSPPYIYFLKYVNIRAPSDVLLRTFSPWSLCISTLFYLSSRFLPIYVISSMYLILRMLPSWIAQANPLYTSTTLLDNHHCCARLFISTLFLCRFFFGLFVCFHIPLRIDLPVYHYSLLVLPTLVYIYIVSHT